MGTLIIGGLLGIALLAIVGTVFAIRGDDTGNQTRTPVAPASTTANGTPTAPLAEPEAQGQQARQPAALPSGDAHDEPAAAPSTDAQAPYVPNGEVHELSTQLQVLHDEALTLSQHLSTLTEMAEQIEERHTVHADDGV